MLSGFKSINNRVALKTNEITINSSGVLKFSSLYLRAGCKAVIGYNESTHQIAVKIFKQGTEMPVDARPFKKNGINIKSFLVNINALPKKTYIEQFVEQNEWVIINLK